MNYVTIITKEGDRWDLIAWRSYGDATKIKDLIATNFHVPITGVIAAGTKIWIPVIEQPALGAEDVPPWKR